MNDLAQKLTGNIYEIRLNGHLNENWVDWFDGMTFTHQDDGTTTLTGKIVDQSALHGVLKRVRDLGLPLISVNNLDIDDSIQKTKGAEQMNKERQYREEEVTIKFHAQELKGILTFPSSDSPCVAIILLHGSDRSPKEDPYYTTHAEELVQSGFVVLRYDGPGWGGKSAQNADFETLESRTEEAITIVKYLQSRSDIQADKIGLWGISQGGWICQMATAASDKIAFIIPTSGPGVTPAEQEVFRVEAESKAAGFGTDEIAKAVLMRRLMVDIILDEPLYAMINQAEAERLGPSPWDEVIDLIYGSQPIESTVEFEKALDLLHAIQGEDWTQALHLDQVLPMFESLPPQAWEMAKGQMRAVMNVNPADFLTKVHCPVLAIFGEADTSIPVEKSVALYQQYLEEAGNDEVTIEIFPKASHTIQVDGEFAPDYFETIKSWLSNLPSRQGKKR